VGNYRTIRSELAQYSPSLAQRPELIVVTKMDVTGALAARARISRELGRDVVAISAVTGQGIPQLIHRLIDLLDSLAESSPQPGSLPDPPLAVLPGSE
jgi:GTP-binding protein